MSLSYTFDLKALQQSCVRLDLYFTYKLLRPVNTECPRYFKTFILLHLYTPPALSGECPFSPVPGHKFTVVVVVHRSYTLSVVWCSQKDTRRQSIIDFFSYVMPLLLARDHTVSYVVVTRLIIRVVSVRVLF